LKEDVLRRWLKSITPNMAHYQRIEDSQSPGIPDSNVCYKGKLPEFWIELKSIAAPVRHTTPVSISLRAGQAPWIYRRHMSGGRTYILLQICLPTNRYTRMLFCGSNALILEEKTLLSDLKLKAIAIDDKIKGELYGV